MSDQRWRLVRDGGGRTYLVPAERWDEADELLDAIEHYWNAPLRNEPYPEAFPGNVPDWMREVRGAYSITFADPQDVA